MGIQKRFKRRRTLREPNAMVLASREHGWKQMVAGTAYWGKNPVYKAQQINGGLARYIKVSCGIPFVRA